MALSDPPHDELFIGTGLGRHGLKATSGQGTEYVEIQILALCCSCSRGYLCKNSQYSVTRGRASVYSGSKVFPLCPVVAVKCSDRCANEAGG
jgi:hypothetical protein